LDASGGFMNLSIVENQYSPVKTKNFEFKKFKAEVSVPEKNDLWMQVARHPLLMPYYRLAVICVLINLFVMWALVQEMTLLSFVKASVLNFAVATLIRQQYVINLLFAVATSAPKTWPLKVRWALGKIYHFGGVHVGCFFSGTVWYGFYVLTLLQSERRPPAGLNVLSVLTFLILLTMIGAALPLLCSRYHNTFEVIARFGNWITLVLFWVQTILIFKSSLTTGNLFLEILRTPSFSFLALITVCVLLPWTELRKVEVKMQKPSSHVVLADFNYGVTPFAGSSTDLSLSPLTEWHSFANVPLPNRNGFKLTISRAGDWTGHLIDQVPSHVWVKGIPAAGVGNIEKLFKKVVWVATGSGIGPCLPHLLSEEVPAHLVWSTRTPAKTYGQDLLNNILQVQPKAVIWDTTLRGKPDLVELAYKAFIESGAEAVICIANKKVTWNVVYELESRGIPCFGAIWDS
jgi:hypothetical protein